MSEQSLETLRADAKVVQAYLNNEIEELTDTHGRRSWERPAVIKRLNSARGAHAAYRRLMEYIAETDPESRLAEQLPLLEESARGGALADLPRRPLGADQSPSGGSLMT